VSGPLVKADDPGVLDAAATALSGGGLVVLPTDTLYGVATLATVPGATSRLFAAKERPPEVALAVLVADVEQASTMAGLGSAAHPDRLAQLLREAWPGPLTVIAPRLSHEAALVDLGGDPATIGVRCPDHDLVRDLARRVGPLATTSANRHGAPTPASAAEAAASLALPPDLVIDGGRCAGEASTVVDCTSAGWPVLRQGGFPEARIKSCLG